MMAHNYSLSPILRDQRPSSDLCKHQEALTINMKAKYSYT